MSGKCHHSLPEAVLAHLSAFVATRLGLHFPRERWSDLDRGARAASKESGAEDTVCYAERVLSATATYGEIEMLARHLTVSETYFFREPRSLDIIEEHIVPTLADRPLRIWCAGCATGEEPYSIAIRLSRVMPDANVTILATDLNARSLQKASEGVYGEWSFRGSPPWIRARYFTATGDRQWAIDPSIKKMVTFARSNLVDDALPSAAQAMDIIFCRNVIMYFHPEAAGKVVRHLHRSLKGGGWLIVSPVETSPTLFSAFSPVHFKDVTLYRKPDVERAAPPLAAVVEPPADHSPEGAVSSPPDDGDRTPAMVRLARACANRGRLREALRWCDKAIATGKADSRAHYLRAAILEEQGSFEEAARSLRRALFLDPKFVIAHFALGNLAVKRGKPQESAKHFENTLHVLAPYQQGDILTESGGLTAGRLRELIARRTHG